MSRCRCASSRRPCSAEAMTDPWSPLCEQCEVEGCRVKPDPPEERRQVRLVWRGMQVVTVQDKYAYAWPGSSALEVGEWVVLPPARGVEDAPEWVGEVTGLGGEWDGDLAMIRSRWREPPPPLYR